MNGASAHQAPATTIQQQGRFASAPELISYAPATGAELWRGAIADVDETVSQARRAWPTWASQPLSTRMELLRRFANELRKDAEKLATMLAHEVGKPLWEAHSEVDNAVLKVEIAIRSYAERCSQRRLDSALQGAMAIRHKPHGVMVVLGPFNCPVDLPLGHIIPALIAGNVVIFKPSEHAPACAEILIRCFHRAGVPASTIQCAFGGREQGEAFVDHDGVDGILFTGSTHTGIQINRRLAERPDKLATLEMGGNNAMIMWDTPKIIDAASIILQSAFTHSGQHCTATRRLIIKDTLYDAVMTEVKALSDRIILDSPLASPAPFMGPVINNASADRLTESVLYLLSNGGRALKHLVRPHGHLPFLSPAIIDVTDMAERPDTEFFGPILQVIRVSDFDEAIAEANATRFGLAAALLGGTPQEYNRFWANVRAGIVNWNRPTIAQNNAAPIGGIGFSGNHRPTGYYAADYCAYPVSSGEMEQPRAVIGLGLQP